MENSETASSNAPERPQRRPLPRTSPARNPASALRASVVAPRPTEVASRVPSATNSLLPDAARQAVETAVALAYRVCDDYLDWGEKAAQERSAANNRRDAMRNSPPNMNEATTQWLQMWQSLAQTWAGYLTPFVGGAPPFGGAPFGGAPFGGAQANVGARPAVNVKVELKSSGATTLAFSLFRAPAPGALKVLLQRQGGVEQLTYTFESPAVLKVTVAGDQVPGKYEGIVRDSAEGACGEMTLIVGELP